jgi:hypothetical protein
MEKRINGGSSLRFWGIFPKLTCSLIILPGVFSLVAAHPMRKHQAIFFRDILKKNHLLHSIAIEAEGE